MIVQHVSGKLLKVISSYELVSTCEYVNEKDYIHSQFMGVKSVNKICIVLNKNIKKINCSKTEQNHFTEVRKKVTDHFVDTNEMIEQQLKLEL
jgi:hypothetical protein